MTETIYREYSCQRWNFWTYCDGIRYSLSATQFALMERQGAICITVR